MVDVHDDFRLEEGDLFDEGWIEAAVSGDSPSPSDPWTAGVADAARLLRRALISDLDPSLAERHLGALARAAAEDRWGRGAAADRQPPRRRAPLVRSAAAAAAIVAGGAAAGIAPGTGGPGGIVADVSTRPAGATSPHPAARNGLDRLCAAADGGGVQAAIGGGRERPAVGRGLGVEERCPPQRAGTTSRPTGVPERAADPPENDHGVTVSDAARSPEIDGREKGAEVARTASSKSLEHRRDAGRRPGDGLAGTGGGRGAGHSKASAASGSGAGDRSARRG